MPVRPGSFSSKRPASQALKLADYGYDNAWRKLRNRRINEEPLCRHCAENGHITPATQVDHIIPRRDGGKDAWENTQSLCDDCHKAKTAEENRRWFGR